MSTAKTTSVDVELSLNEFDAGEIIDHLKKCYLTSNELKELKEYVENELKERDLFLEAEPIIKLETLADIEKAELFAEVMNKYSWSELKKRLA